MVCCVVVGDFIGEILLQGDELIDQFVVGIKQMMGDLCMVIGKVIEGIYGFIVEFIDIVSQLGFMVSGVQLLGVMVEEMNVIIEEFIVFINFIVSNVCSVD